MSIKAEHSSTHKKGSYATIAKRADFSPPFFTKSKYMKTFQYEFSGRVNHNLPKNERMGI